MPPESEDWLAQQARTAVTTSQLDRLQAAGERFQDAPDRMLADFGRDLLMAVKRRRAALDNPTIPARILANEFDFQHVYPEDLDALIHDALQSDDRAELDRFHDVAIRMQPDDSVLRAEFGRLLERAVQRRMGQLREAGRLAPEYDLTREDTSAALSKMSTATDLAWLALWMGHGARLRNGDPTNPHLVALRNLGRDLERTARERYDTVLGERLTRLPLLPLPTVVFPQIVASIEVAQLEQQFLILETMRSDRVVGLVLERDAAQQAAERLSDVGTLGMIEAVVLPPDGSMDGNRKVTVRGIERVRILEIDKERYFYPFACAELMPETVEQGGEMQALTAATQDLFERLVALAEYLPRELVAAARSVKDSRQLAYFVATNLEMDAEERQIFLEIDSLREKLSILATYIVREPIRSWRDSLLSKKAT